MSSSVSVIYLYLLSTHTNTYYLFINNVEIVQLCSNIAFICLNVNLKPRSSGLLVLFAGCPL